MSGLGLIRVLRAPVGCRTEGVGFSGLLFGLCKVCLSGFIRLMGFIGLLRFVGALYFRPGPRAITKALRSVCLGILASGFSA